MLIHITPRFVTCEQSGPNIELVDLRIDELGLFLRGGKEITTRRPYPNKHFNVACRNIGRKAVDGILIETDKPLAELTLEMRWAAQADSLMKHRVRYVVIDRDFDAVSDNMLLWTSDGTWPSRWPEVHKGAIPMNVQPHMKASPSANRAGMVEDRLVAGRIVERSETFPVPTLERERLLSPDYAFAWPGARPPSIDTAFRIA
jgi:hypothetical protein